MRNLKDYYKNYFNQTINEDLARAMFNAQQEKLRQKEKQQLGAPIQEETPTPSSSNIQTKISSKTVPSSMGKTPTTQTTRSENKTATGQTTTQTTKTSGDGWEYSSEGTSSVERTGAIYGGQGEKARKQAQEIMSQGARGAAGGSGVGSTSNTGSSRTPPPSNTGSSRTPPPSNTGSSRTPTTPRRGVPSGRGGGGIDEL